MRRVSDLRHDDLSDAWIEANASPDDLADWKYMREQHPGYVQNIDLRIWQMIDSGKIPRDEALLDYIDRTVDDERTRRIMHGILVQNNAYHVQTDDARRERIVERLTRERQAREEKAARRREQNAAAARRYRARKRAQRDQLEDGPS